MHFNVWDDLNIRLSKDEELYKKYSFFWATTLKAQLEAAQLHLIKLFDKSRKSVTIDRIINYAEKNQEKIFKQDLHLVVEMEINDYKKDIKNLISL